MSHVSLHTNEVSMLQKEMPRLMTCSRLFLQNLSIMQVQPRRVAPDEESSRRAPAASDLHVEATVAETPPAEEPGDICEVSLVLELSCTDTSISSSEG
jgi:hypothetical protein